MTFLQLRLKNRNETREAKIDILTNAWNKLLGQIHDNNLNVNNKKAQKLVIAIGKVRHEIRRAALEEFLRCCQRVHTIAFL